MPTCSSTGLGFVSAPRTSPHRSSNAPSSAERIMKLPWTVRLQRRETNETEPGGWFQHETPLNESCLSVFQSGCCIISKVKIEHQHIYTNIIYSISKHPCFNGGTRQPCHPRVCRSEWRELLTWRLKQVEGGPSQVDWRLKLTLPWPNERAPPRPWVVSGIDQQMWYLPTYLPTYLATVCRSPGIGRTGWNDRFAAAFGGVSTSDSMVGMLRVLSGSTRPQIPGGHSI